MTIQYYFTGALILLSVGAKADTEKVLINNDSVFIVEIQTTYVLGDNDSRLDAIDLALQSAKSRAADLAGTYILTERTFTNGQLAKESIQTINAAILKTVIKSKLFSLTYDERIQLRLHTVSQIDKTRFSNKLKLLSDNSAMRKQVESIEKENHLLKSRLASLNNELSRLAREPADQKINASKNRVLLNQREDIIINIDRNNKIVKKVFEQGTLYSMAMKSTSDYENAILDIENNFFKKIQTDIEINVGEPKFSVNENGSYNVEVMIDWHIDNDPLKTILAKYFNLTPRPIFNSFSRIKMSRKNTDAIIEVNNLLNNKKHKKHAYNERLFSYLKKKVVTIRIKAGKYSGDYEIGRRDTRRGTCNGGRCFQFISKLLPYDFDDNPVVIKNVPASAIEKLISIEAEVIIHERN